MEDQNIITTTKPRITLKKNSRGCGWEISSSSSEDKAELKLIVAMIEEVNQDMENKFAKKREANK